VSERPEGKEPAVGRVNDVQYLTHVVKTIRGREAITRSKLENEGWEFVSQTPAALRTEMSFRRPKPKALLAYLQQGWAAFRRLPRTAQRALAGALAAVVVLVVVVSVVASQGGDAPVAAAPPSTEAAVPNPAASSVPSSSTPAGPPATETAAPPENPEEPAEEPADEPTDPSGAAEVLTAKNNKDLAAILATTDTCGSRVQSFAKKYEGRTVEFDGSVSAMNNHDSHKTRFDIMVSPGNKGSQSTRGPNFQFRDVNYYDLNLVGDDIPDSVGLDDKLHVVATVDRFPSNQCLLLIEPVSTRVR
jgi:hypothetical protein